MNPEERAVVRARLTATAAALDAAGPRVPYLVVVEETSSFPFPLPAQGEVVIGRGAEVDLPLEGHLASRRHAAIQLGGGEVRVRDLGSRNGTAVNGERIEGDRLLFTGDSISIGKTLFILYLPPAAASRLQLGDARAFRRRLQEEVERARHFERTVGIVALLLEAGADREAVDRRIDVELRTVDMAGWLSPTELGVVLPEVSEADREAITRRLLERMAAIRVPARAGFAAYPHAACDADALMAAARAAARGAENGAVADPDTGACLEIGERAVVVADPAMTGLYELVRRLAPSDLPVLIQGETGVGKENAAYALHCWSRRHAGPFIAVNCAALPEGLAESELFGSEKGAFSGATASRPGLFEAGAGGTIFFDEIGELPPALQAKLLRVLDSKRVMRVGATQEKEIDVRVVAASNRDLVAEEKAGRFRRDLFFRLNAATVVLPPLRNRPREVAILARTFLSDSCERLGLPAKTFSGASLHLLTRHPWPGNVRELKNVVEYLAATSLERVIEPAELLPRLGPASIVAAAVAAAAAATAAATASPPPAAPPPPAGEGASTTPAAGTLLPLADEIRELERRRMRQALEAVGWVQTRAAELIGVPLRTFQQKVKQYGLTRRDGSEASFRSD